MRTRVQDSGHHIESSNSEARKLSTNGRIQLTRRDMVKLSAGGAGLFALTASGFAVPRGTASGGSVYLEAFPTSPLILNPFKDELNIPKALRPQSEGSYTSWASKPGKDNQDCFAEKYPSLSTGKYSTKYSQPLGCHQKWPSDKAPLVYQIKAEVAGHGFTTSQVQPINSAGLDATPPGSNTRGPRNLPDSTIYGFNGTFPG